MGKKANEIQSSWNEKIQRAKKVHKNWSDMFLVEKGRNYFEGRQNPGLNSDEWITINKIYSFIKASLPSLYAHDPYFYVKLRRSFNPDPQAIEQYEQKAKVRQAMLNYLKDKLDMKTKVRLAIQDSMFAYGVVKVCYEAKFEDNPLAGKPIRREDGSVLWDETGNRAMVEPEENLLSEQYSLKRIHPDDFIWDEDASVLEETWKWIGQRIRMTMDDAKKDPRFKKRVLKNMAGDNDTKDNDQRTRRERQKGADLVDSAPTEETGENQIINVWEIYDLQNERYHVFAENADEPLVYDQPLPPGVCKHPFAILRFTFRDDSPYPITPVSQGLDPQREYNLARSSVITHRKRFTRKYQVIKAGLIDEESDLSKLESGDDGTCIPVNMAGTISPIADAPLDPARYAEINLLNRDMTEVLGGIADEARGIASADSATQASILDKHLEVRESDAIALVIDFVREIARKLDFLVQSHLDQEEAVKVVGPEGEFWQTVTPDAYDEIYGEYEYSVNVGATLPRMPHIERASWMAFLTLVSQFPQILTKKRVLKIMADMHHIDDDAAIEELFNLGQQMTSGQMPMPGNSGSAAGVPESSPIAAMGGMAGGVQSLNLPMAGNPQPGA